MAHSVTFIIVLTGVKNKKLLVMNGGGKTMIDQIERIERQTKVFMGREVQSDEQIIKYVSKQLRATFPEATKEQLEQLINSRQARALATRALVQLDDLVLLGFKDQINAAILDAFAEANETQPE